MTFFDLWLVISYGTAFFGGYWYLNTIYKKNNEVGPIAVLGWIIVTIYAPVFLAASVFAALIIQLPKLVACFRLKKE